MDLVDFCIRIEGDLFIKLKSLKNNSPIQLSQDTFTLLLTIHQQQQQVLLLLLLN